MPSWTRVLGALTLVAAAGSARGAADAEAKHAAIAAYEGTRTCARCHEKQVKDFVTSLHYQQQAPAPFLANAQQAKSAGMMVSY
ncbi:hypothetical protein [Anaeromyxobacter diazotrophicus]|uniref:Cytochrome c domain-containing protein n=1 Tax=Anaeromyxobacter diazotrophicus TaxID=2590199 RepID=A0A7I9VHX3_9BACT|nr:hypothetical protein [Anaeromyxobacter diazotrophicus]GEJ55720.1 hypothetical protein AMYX_04610 [Anaeromyxobacter diazotrophicus]